MKLVSFFRTSAILILASFTTSAVAEYYMMAGTTPLVVEDGCGCSRPIIIHHHYRCGCHKPRIRHHRCHRRPHYRPPCRYMVRRHSCDSSSHWRPRYNCNGCNQYVTYNEGCMSWDARTCDDVGVNLNLNY